jgi:hypothetical protein
MAINDGVPTTSSIDQAELERRVVSQIYAQEHPNGKSTLRPAALPAVHGFQWRCSLAVAVQGTLSFEDVFSRMLQAS